MTVDHRWTWIGDGFEYEDSGSYWECVECKAWMRLRHGDRPEGHESSQGILVDCDEEKVRRLMDG